MADIKPTSVNATPLDIPYIKKLIFSLNILGFWPHEIMGRKEWFSPFRNSKVLFIVWLSCLILGTSYINTNYDILSFLDQGRLLINVLMCSVCVQRATMPWTKLYKDTTKDFINKVHLLHHKDKNDFAMKTYINVEKLSALFSQLVYIELFSGVLFFNLTPLYNNYRRGMFDAIKPVNGTYDQACSYDYVPFDYTTNFNGFIVIYVLNAFFSFDIAGTVCILDLYIFIIIFHIWGHIKILKHNLVTFPRPEIRGQIDSCYNSPWYNEEESRKVTHLLVESIEHYRLIHEFMKDISTAWGATICFYFFFHQLSECILLVELTQMSAQAFGTFGILTFTLFQQLVTMSIVFELIGSQSETIKDAVYGVPWESMDIKNRQLVLIYLCNVQKPLNFKALGMLPVGVQTMASILKTSISYFMLLRASAASNSS